MTLAPDRIVGSQTPTYLWVPPHSYSYGAEAVALYDEAVAPLGWTLDVWQKLMVGAAFAHDADHTLTCFELGCILSRQNGKGEPLLAIETAWLFLFNVQLVIHSAHLFETSTEHFAKLLALIETNPDFDRRVLKVFRGRGSEEVRLKSGARLKLMTRKGGAGRGFTAEKLVLDEAMILDAQGIQAAVPTMATKAGAQIIYAGSAGGRNSAQFGSVRRRGLNRDPTVGLIAFEAERPVYDEHGTLVAGDDPADPRTWAKTNPALNRPINGISEAYVAKEAGTFGGFTSALWWQERLGIGDWPVDEDLWEVVSSNEWLGCYDPESKLSPVGRIYGVECDEATGVYTLGVGGRRGDKLVHVETIRRQRGSAWVLPDLFAIFADRGKRSPVMILKSSPAAHLRPELERKRVKVPAINEQDYAAACEGFVQDARAGLLRHVGQPAAAAALGSAGKRETVKGSWTWDRDRPNQGPIIVSTLVRWAVRQGLGGGASKVF